MEPVYHLLELPHSLHASIFWIVAKLYSGLEKVGKKVGSEGMSFFDNQVRNFVLTTSRFPITELDRTGYLATGNISRGISEVVTAHHSMMTKHRQRVTDRHSMTKHPSSRPSSRPPPRLPPRPPPCSSPNCPRWPLASMTYHSSHVAYRISTR